MPPTRNNGFDPYAARRKPPRPGRVKRFYCDAHTRRYYFRLPAPLKTGGVVSRLVIFTLQTVGRFSIKVSPNLDWLEVYIPWGCTFSFIIIDYDCYGEPSDPNDPCSGRGDYIAPPKPGPLFVKSIEPIRPAKPGPLTLIDIVAMPPPRPAKPSVKLVEPIPPPRPGRPSLAYVEALGPPRPGPLAVADITQV